MLDFFINPNKAADAEIDSGGLSSRGKMTEWDFGDRFRHAIFGNEYSRENLEARARERQTTRFNESDAITALNTELSQYRPGTTITRKPGESLADMRARGDLEKGLGMAISQAKITNPTVDFSGVTNYQQLQSLIGQDNNRIETEQTAKADQKEADSIRRYEAGLLRDHNLQVRQLDGQIAQEQARLAADERQAKREHEATLRGYDNQLASYNMENARLMQQEENRRADRKEKALYTLIASLSNLGASFSI